MASRVLLYPVLTVMVAARDAAIYSTAPGETVLSTINFDKEMLIWPAGSLPPGENASSPYPNETKHCLTRGVPVAQCKDLMIGDVSIPTLQAFLVPSSKSAMIVAPGGGYSGLAVDREGYDIADWLNSIGVNAFVLKVNK